MCPLAERVASLERFAWRGRKGPIFLHVHATQVLFNPRREMDVVRAGCMRETALSVGPLSWRWRFAMSNEWNGSELKDLTLWT